MAMLVCKAEVSGGGSRRAAYARWISSTRRSTREFISFCTLLSAKQQPSDTSTNGATTIHCEAKRSTPVTAGVRVRGSAHDKAVRISVSFFRCLSSRSENFSRDSWHLGGGFRVRQRMR